MNAASPNRVRFGAAFGVAGSMPVLISASASGKSSDHGSMPIGVWLAGLLMKELLTLFGEPTTVTLIPIAARLALITSAIFTNPGASFWQRSVVLIGSFTPEAVISALAWVRLGGSGYALYGAKRGDPGTIIWRGPEPTRGP